MREFILIFALFLAAIPTAAAGDPPSEYRSPIEELRHQTSPDVLEWLRLRFETAGMIVSSGGPGDPFGEVKEEIERRRTSAETAYVEALNVVKAKPEAERLLKEFYSVWLAALDGLNPQTSEIRRFYNARQAESSRRVNEAWYRFQTEALTP